MKMEHIAVSEGRMSRLRMMACGLGCGDVEGMLGRLADGDLVVGFRKVGWDEAGRIARAVDALPVIEAEPVAWDRIVG